MRSDDRLASGQAQEAQTANAAIATARALNRAAGNVGAIAFKRTGDPNTGEFTDAEILIKVGETPEHLSEW